MPRRSQRKSTSSLPSRPAPARASNPTSARKSTGKASPKSTPTKSRYFKKDSGKEKEDSDTNLDESSAPDLEESGYEEDEQSLAESDTEPPETDSASEEEPQAKKRKRSTKPAPAKSVPAGKRAKGQELWREGVETGLAPGTQVIIKKPKARDAGKTPYKPNTIHPNTFLFLKDLKENNDREWLKMHDPDYRASQKDFNDFIECLTSKVAEADETVPELPVKDIVFRIYRDVRFSNDPTPYKTHFAAAWSRTGRKGPYAAYYFQMSPGDCFIGGGLWMPDAQGLAAMRRDIDRKPERIKRVLSDARLRKEMLGVASGDERKVVSAFVARNAQSALKTKPKGFDADHKDITLLRLRNFTIGKKLSDQDVLGTTGLSRVAELVSIMVPFITYLNDVVMPDNPDESSSSDESADDD